MKADGAQLREITSLLEAGTIKPVIDRVFPSTLSTRRSGKVVVQLK